MYNNHVSKGAFIHTLQWTEKTSTDHINDYFYFYFIFSDSERSCLSKSPKIKTKVALEKSLKTTKGGVCVSVRTKAKTKVFYFEPNAFIST